jgi:UDP-N-acetylmuramoyl-L-alanyl-D-glutamate--2,6-diaminopimelate ligase
VPRCCTPEFFRAAYSPAVAVERHVALTALLGRLQPPAAIIGEPQVSVDAIETDSRKVRPGALFVAVAGSRTDGHLFIGDAMRNGARAVIAQTRTPAGLPSGVTIAQVDDSRRALSAIAAAFHGDPSHALDVIGVTGTNGKTTKTHMVAAICNAAGEPCGVIGTIGAEFGSLFWPVENTTPLPPELHRLLARMRDEGAKAVAMEVSSHALALDRVDDVRFRVAVLTNVTRDHLDFHETLEAYTAAKRRLFSMAPACVLNVDDPNGKLWAHRLKAEGREVVTYGLKAGADLVPEPAVHGATASAFALDGQPFHLRIAGDFNVYNALAAVGVARVLGIDQATAARGLAAVDRVAGRMERVDAIDVDDVAAYVDYAHTPDALDSALSFLRRTTTGPLAVVFGCGGDRDYGKRAEMGAVAARFADRIYVTSDNPRSEDPQAIVDAIVKGIGGREYVVELDRRHAIERAVAEAQAGDVVLVAGKGHEAYQIVGDRVLPFDDAAVAREALASRGVLR